jgi:ClpP class serine protease
MSELRQFAPRGVIALEPQAFGASWEKQTQPEPYCVIGRCAVVSVCGPLAYQRTPDNWFQTYSEITVAVRAASEAPGVDTILLKVASPGGDVPGAFDCARDIRGIAQASGKKFISFTESQASSAGYALACAADQIVISDVAKVGSIGVITMIADATALDAVLGVRFTVISSGARKADGNPHTATTDQAVAAVQAEVDATASVFFAHVAGRRGIPLESVAALQAAQFVGMSAIGVGLVDSVESFSSLTRRLQNPTLVSAEGIPPMPDDKDKPKEDAVRAALVTASESDDADKASKAKRALAAYDAEESDDDADKKPAKDDKSDDDKASAAVASAVAPLAKQFAKTQTTIAAQAAEIASLKAESDTAKRNAIFASRPDLAPEFVSALAETPTSALKAVVDAVPVPKGFVNPFMAVAVNKPVVGATQGGRPVMSANAELNAEMGLIKMTSGTEYKDGSQIFGVRKPVGDSK